MNLRNKADHIVPPRCSGKKRRKKKKSQLPLSGSQEEIIASCDFGNSLDNRQVALLLA